MLSSTVGALSQSGAGSVISAKNLMNLRQKALRRGLWFKALNRLDRVLVDLTIRVSSSVHSSLLAVGLLTVAQKLQNAFESKLGRATRNIGFQLTQKLSQIAQQWGNKAAQAWANDPDFARYLAAMSLNGHPLT